MKRKLVAIITFIVAGFAGLVTFSAVTVRKIANMRLTQYAYDVNDNTATAPTE